MKTSRLKFLICAITLAASNAVKSETLHLQLHGFSYHTKRTQGDGAAWNERNYGLGVRRDVSQSLSWQVGFYKNSESRQSFYAVANWFPAQISNEIRAGMFAGVANGYSIGGGAPIPVGGAALRWQGHNISLTARLLPKTPKTVTAAVGVELGLSF